MKFSLSLLGLVAPALCSPTVALLADRAAVEAECGELGVMDWNLEGPSANTDISALRKCKKHPSELGIASPAYNPDIEENDLESISVRSDIRLFHRQTPSCEEGGRGKGHDYDYGCDKGWCWRNCGGPFGLTYNKPWCWLAYEGGKGGWTPCGGWKDCEWSYNNKNAKCAKGNCKACGCGC
ncbi:hypothetical protein HJFPF1_02366 [Paramyrothecium foliicola]|nr:hypothetical protein HJFPF1_02366 [Paramyrothecium foliicola]